MKKPIFLNLWNNFPLHSQFSTLKDLYTWLGGQVERNINIRGFGESGNACASRMSVALNKSGFLIDPKLAKKLNVTTLKAKDETHIIFRVNELKKYLTHTIGIPTIKDIKTPFDDLFVLKSGIVFFDIPFGNATGHVALYNGINYREPTYDDYSTYVKESNPKIKTKRSLFWEIS
ncbi:T6SS effector amidase Tae4 family protein [Taylorella equigenitalis]|uniref:NlpC/P60 domain-containing protein n=1 Tax=Taylorella equigenitalis ATCC 35865 TaxID=743973 RepID=A0ABM5N912_9BURK|nr:T6SS effector amidase Tae4 family protein [Taylorella equigenitalis]AFN35231.1 hypothetical protein KUI_0130 [Taylorella equigenitalis ATCC 35865]ASY38672.1 hypothetical protein CA604_00640 [Taylorella equigenitalis]WDU47988.1 type VI secretion system amidase effector protein Tae4 [Taylorella equigenitalis]WDU53480.1 type VI secretion system amidase effector protein Tae4 [Taylorella equigenitalis]VEG30260.1 Uncharacterised protein [Taylorella equigenitalis ATCC 35865]